MSIIENGTIKKSAFDMNITPSAISHSINELEQRLGYKLFKRTLSGLVLTYAGNTFYKNIIEPIEQLNEILSDAKNLKEKSEVSIKMDGIYCHKVYSALDSIKQKYPKKSISVTSEEIFDIKNELKKGFADIVISTVDSNFTDNSIQRMSFAPEKFGILINRDMYEKYKNIKDIFKKEILIHSPSTLQHVTFKNLVKKLEKHDFNTKIMSMNEMDLINCVSKGIGFTICLDDLYNSWDLKNKNLIFIISNPFPFKCFINRKAYFLYERGHELTEIISIINNQNT